MPKRSRLAKSGTKPRSSRLATVSTPQMDLLAKFEFNVSGREWMELWKKFDKTKDVRLGQHLWDKFESHDHSILHVMGYADSYVASILPKMVSEWGKRHKGSWSG